MDWVLIVILVILFLGVFPMFFVQLFLANHLYNLYLVRNDKENWTREMTPESAEDKAIAESALKFKDENKQYIKEVEIISEGYKLKGQYLDYGYQKAVIIVAGRSEACTYSYHFAYPYKECGYNILVIDNRSHGLSEGKYNCLGFEEYKDILNWVRYLHDSLNNKEIIGHGICIGSATLLYALTNESCPSYFKGMVCDGMYQNFVISFNNHSKEAGHGVHFVSDFFFAKFKKVTGHNAKIGPIDYIDKYNKPILFINSYEDKYSTSDKTIELFNKCISTQKEIKFFDKGIHSHVRINNMIEYDKQIIDFMDKYF